MANLKARLKHLFYITGTASLLDKFVYGISFLKNSFLKNRKKNLKYKKANPHLKFPPDYFLYETYVLDYEEYLTDGENSAREIVEWTDKYLKEKPRQILEWGCGVGGIIRHLPTFSDPGSMMYGCDVNESMIKWDTAHIEGVSFSINSFHPPTRYQAEMFDLVYGISIFTHIGAQEQEGWIKEIHRILKDGGVFLFTTHGNNFFHQLTRQEQNEVNSNGAYTRPYRKKGHRMMTSYNGPESFAALLGKYFVILEFYDGQKDRTNAGGQDLWIVKKNGL